MKWKIFTKINNHGKISMSHNVYGGVLCMDINALELAEYVIDKCAKDGNPISNLQLQKILYFLQEEICKSYGKSLFFNRIEAWQYGPVVPSVYNRYWHYGADYIKPKNNTDIKIDVDDTVKRVIDNTIEKYGRFSPWSLVEKTHKVGTPWDKAYKKGAFTEIKVSDILEYVK